MKARGIRKAKRNNDAIPPCTRPKSRARIEQISEIGETPKEINFFLSTYLFEWMSELKDQVIDRLSGKSSQAVFRITQPPGYGKTHLLIYLGLLVKSLRFGSATESILLAENMAGESIKVIAIDGSRHDIDLYAEIAGQVGCDHSKDGDYLREARLKDWLEPFHSNQPMMVLVDNMSTDSGFALDPLIAAAEKTKRSCVIVANHFAKVPASQIRDTIIQPSA